MRDPQSQKGVTSGNPRMGIPERRAIEAPATTTMYMSASVGVYINLSPVHVTGEKLINNFY